MNFVKKKLIKNFNTIFIYVKFLKLKYLCIIIIYLKRYLGWKIMIKVEIIKLQKYLNVLNDNYFLWLFKYSVILIKYWNKKKSL